MYYRQKGEKTFGRYLNDLRTTLHLANEKNDPGKKIAMAF